MSNNPSNGKYAVIIGAGMGGLLAAAALSDTFEQITIVEKDVLPESPQFRKGVAQGAHVHTLLGYGVEAMNELLPGLMSDLYAAGAVKIRRNFDIWFHDAIGPTPIRDVDILTPSVTRPLLEHVTRQRVAALPNVKIRDSTKVLDYEVDCSKSVSGIHVMSNGNAELISADLVVECSGRASKLARWLPAHGFGDVPSQQLKISMCYTSGFFSMPKDINEKGKACLMLAVPPGYRAAYLTPVDGNLWLATMYGRANDVAPPEHAGFVAWAAGLPHPVIHETLIRGEPATDLKTYKIPYGVWHRYDQMEDFPQGLIPLGEALTSFNPMYGQGMSLAAGQALSLRTAVKSGEDRDLSKKYFDGCHTQNSIGWAVMETRDFAHDCTSGDRPTDLEERWKTAHNIRQLAEIDPEVHTLSVRVTHLLESPSEFTRPDILKKINDF